MVSKNPIGLDGIEFIEFSSDQPQKLEVLFLEFGFSKLYEHSAAGIDYFKQGDIHFLVNRHADSFGRKFAKMHGPCVSSMAWRVKDSKAAHQEAIKRGAKDATEFGDYTYTDGMKVKAIYGIGESLLYFIEPRSDLYSNLGFKTHKEPKIVKDKGFEVVDHLTNNVHKGTMEHWANFYKNVFGFEEVRYFDIRGVKTGLTSFALRSPCGKFCIPINEGTDKKSQINEFLEEYNGPGVQHIAFLTRNIIGSIDALKGSSIETLDIDDDYYQEVFKRVPNVKEDHKKLQQQQILIDGDEDGYLLQIFTKNLVGPIFIEVIQRNNNQTFGEGNFGALFRAIERDQEKRGYL